MGAENDPGLVHNVGEFKWQLKSFNRLSDVLVVADHITRKGNALGAQASVKLVRTATTPSTLSQRLGENRRTVSPLVINSRTENEAARDDRAAFFHKALDLLPSWDRSHGNYKRLPRPPTVLYRLTFHARRRRLPSGLPGHGSIPSARYGPSMRPDFLTQGRRLDAAVCNESPGPAYFFPSGIAVIASWVKCSDSIQ